MIKRDDIGIELIVDFQAAGCELGPNAFTLTCCFRGLKSLLRIELKFADILIVDKRAFANFGMHRPFLRHLVKILHGAWADDIMHLTAMLRLQLVLLKFISRRDVLSFFRF